MEDSSRNDARVPVTEAYVGSPRLACAERPSKGVFVLGMHRSGTSATAGAIHLLGVPAGDPNDHMTTDNGNAGGYFELISLMKENNLVLAVQGSNWSCPPRVEAGWQDQPAIAQLVPRARACFQQRFPTSEWVWKDPRNCITFPFWSTALSVEEIAVVVTRNPLEIVDSLVSIHNFTRRHVLALWERSMRACLNAVVGRPVFICSYEQIISHPTEWIQAVFTFLRSNGMTIDLESTIGDVASFLEPKLRRNHRAVSEFKNDPDSTPEQVRLHGYLEANLGIHLPWDAPVLGAESPTTELILAEHRNYARMYMGKFEAESLKIAHERERMAFQIERRRWEAERAGLLDLTSPRGPRVNVIY